MLGNYQPPSPTQKSETRQYLNSESHWMTGKNPNTRTIDHYQAINAMRNKTMVDNQYTVLA